MKKFFFFFSLLASLSSYSASYILQSPASSMTEVRFRIGYTFGTHRGEAQEMTGELSVNEADLAQVRGSFFVPIDSLNTDHPVRDCHLRESLGLDYNVSHFPKEHVCIKGTSLPESGVDSMVFPFVSFTITSVVHEKGDLLSKRGAKLRVTGIWNIHGKDVTQEMDVFLKKETSGEYVLEGVSKATLHLKDFGIIVKDAKKGPITIKASDKIYLNLKLVFK